MKKLYPALFSVAVLLLLLPSTLLAQTSNPAAAKRNADTTGMAASGKNTVGNSINCTMRTWVLDADNDGYYSGDPVTQCDNPGTGWVPFTPTEQPGDCDDNNPDINPATIWVVDVDHDGYYQGTGNPVTQCERPALEYLLKINEQPGDCDDGNASIHPKIWVIDADEDGYYTGDPVTQCYSPGNEYVVKTGQQPGDCNDNDPSINPATVWVLDNDLDGYYTGNPVTQCASPGARWVMLTSQQPGDCNDNDPDVSPATQWVLDYDQDGFYTGDVVTQCISPGAYYVIKTNQQPGDCDDYDPTVKPSNLWVLDADKDGWYTGDIVQQCYSPGDGYVQYINSYNEQPGDCNDNDASVNPATEWILDADGDGFYADDPVTQCTSPGDGYVIKTNQQPGDCDDNDASLNPNTKWVEDVDGDGYYNDSVYTCAIWDRGWYKWNENFKFGDCDDNDASINIATVWVLDADNDGYYTGDPVTQCTSPGNGWVNLANSKEHRGDCNDNDPSVTNGVTWVLDADNDGYYTGDPVVQCTSPGNGWINLADQEEQPGDCNDNDPSVTNGVTWVLDADNDGYYTGDPVVQCTSPGNGWIKFADRKELPGDCMDNNPAVHPGAVEICGNGIDDNCNGEIDENCTVSKIKITIADKAVKEGNKGQKNMVFNVTLNKKSTQPVQVDYTTIDNTATAGSDYVAASGTLNFSSGIKKQKIIVLINGDKTTEADETFEVILSNPVNAAIANSVGYGTILNDDGAVKSGNEAYMNNEKIYAAAKNISLYPNPAQQKFNIIFTGYTGNVLIDISSLDGRKLQQIKLTDVSPKYIQQVNLSNYINGIYLVTVTDEKGISKTLKLVVIK